MLADRGLFIVADGMGGHAAGEVASEMAVRTIAREVGGLQGLDDGGVSERMANAIRTANDSIYQRTVSEPEKRGMGTTVTVLALLPNRYLIGQVGDSRAYLLRNNEMLQLTKDHSYVQEQVDAGLLTPEQARYHPYSNVITRCVGASEEVEADTFSGEFRSGDVFLVCSDGLTGMVDDRRLQQLLLSRASAGRIVDALIAEANYRGGLDNVTAVVVQILSADTGDDEKTEESPALATPTSNPATNAA